MFAGVAFTVVTHQNGLTPGDILRNRRYGAMCRLGIVGAAGTVVAESKCALLRPIHQGNIFIVNAATKLH